MLDRLLLRGGFTTEHHCDPRVLEVIRQPIARVSGLEDSVIAQVHARDI